MPEHEARDVGAHFDELAEEINKHGGARPDGAVIAALYAKYDSELVT